MWIRILVVPTTMESLIKEIGLWLHMGTRSLMHVGSLVVVGRQVAGKGATCENYLLYLLTRWSLEEATCCFKYVWLLVACNTIQSLGCAVDFMSKLCTNCCVLSLFMFCVLVRCLLKCIPWLMLNHKIGLRFVWSISKLSIVVWRMDIDTKI
jgi:hypothetical protein